MEKKNLNAKKIYDAYKVLERAKYQKLEDDDKVKLWKISRKLKAVADRYGDDVRDAEEKFRPDGVFGENLQKAIQYEAMKKDGKTEDLPLTEEKYLEVLAAFKSYRELVEKAVKELSEAETEVEMELLSEEAFGKLLSSNDWTLNEVGQIDFIIAKE